MKEMKIDDVKAEKEKKAQEPAVHEKAAEKLKQAARSLNETDGNLEATFAAIREKQLLKDIEVLRAECADLKEDNRQLKDGNIQTNNQLRVRNQEVIDLKERLARSIEEREKADRTVAEQMKTISKMQLEHEAEVQDLKDQLGEAKAAEAAAKKAHAHAVDEKNDYADALDDDSIAFEEILSLAILMERGAKSMHDVSKMIQAKTEGRV